MTPTDIGEPPEKFQVPMSKLQGCKRNKTVGKEITHVEEYGRGEKGWHMTNSEGPMAQDEAERPKRETRG